MKTILFVHQSADMYGSDKMLISLIKGLDKQQFRPVVLLPCHGPLLLELYKLDISVFVLPLLILGRASLSYSALLSMPFNLLRSMRALTRTLKGIDIDLVHTNTLAVISGALWARLKKIPHVWHVHEIIEHPPLASRFFPLLVRFFATRVVCNSFATQKKLLQFQPALAAKSVVIWNGLSYASPSCRQAAEIFRTDLGIQPNHIVVALVGRINRWKGQEVLVAAASDLHLKGERNICYLIVGGPPNGQEHFRTRLADQIGLSPAQAAIKLLDFTDDIAVVWAACDIAVIPSTEPEPFGLVALEAMSAGKPVIAANHGGLPEIVQNGISGILVIPGSSPDLAQAIKVLAENLPLRESMGSRGKATQLEKFSIRSYVNSFSELYSSL